MEHSRQARSGLDPLSELGTCKATTRPPASRTSTNATGGATWSRVVVSIVPVRDWRRPRPTAARAPSAAGRTVEQEGAQRQIRPAPGDQANRSHRQHARQQTGLEATSAPRRAERIPEPSHRLDQQWLLHIYLLAQVADERLNHVAVATEVVLHT